MLKQVVSSVLITALLAGSVSLVPASAAENNKASDTSEIKTITVGIKDDVKTYYDENGNEVNPTKTDKPLRLKTNLPSSYDLRDYGRSTSVKDQGTEGLCWAFASTASVESSILTKGLSKETSETLDLSEGGNSWYIHTNTTDTTSPLYNEYMFDIKKGGAGGLSIYVADSLSSGYGTYPESMLRYEDYMINDYPEDYRFYSDYRLKDYNEFDDFQTRHYNNEFGLNLEHKYLVVMLRILCHEMSHHINIEDFKYDDDDEYYDCLHYIQDVYKSGTEERKRAYRMIPEEYAADQNAAEILRYHLSDLLNLYEEN